MKVDVKRFLSDAYADTVRQKIKLDHASDGVMWDEIVAEVRRVCRKGGVILILNHFTGSRFWWALERIARPMADRIGFRSDFDYAEQVLRHDHRNFIKWKMLRATSKVFGNGFAAFANEQGLRLNADVEAFEPIKAAFDMRQVALSDGVVAYARGIGTLAQHTQVVTQSMEILPQGPKRRASR